MVNRFSLNIEIKIPAYNLPSPFYLPSNVANSVCVRFFFRFDFCLHFPSMAFHTHGKYSCKSSRCAFTLKLSAILCLERKIENKMNIPLNESAIFRWWFNIQIQVKFKIEMDRTGLWKGKVNFSIEKFAKKRKHEWETVEVIIWTF